MNDLRMSGENAREIIRNCHALLKNTHRGRVLWSMVSEITGHGSGYSIEICKSAKLDPFQYIGKGALKDL